MTERGNVRKDALHNTDRETNSGITLATNDDLNLLCAVIESMKPDWDNISQTVSQISDKERESLHGRLAEEHVKSLLTYLSGTDLFKDVLKPVSAKGKSTGHYRFLDNSGSIIAKHRRSRRDYTIEYDNIWLIGGLPTLLEVKAKSNNRSGTNPFQQLFYPEQRNQLFQPLQELFQTNNFGYVVVTVPERISSISSVQKKFREDGGKIVAMCTNLEELKEHAGTIIFQPPKGSFSTRVYSRGPSK